MRKLVFATNNQHKLEEIVQLLPSEFNLLSLSQIGCEEDIPETGNTLEANASQKSNYIWERYGIDCFADDTGLEIEALDQEPGVYSARYAGPQRDATDNMNKVLSMMEGQTNRKARFRSVISLIMDGEERQFEGVVNGVILTERAGASGFGYDPIFKPEGFDRSFAQMSLGQKNQISHRAIAVRKLIAYLRSL